MYEFEVSGRLMKGQLINAGELSKGWIVLIDEVDGDRARILHVVAMGDCASCMAAELAGPLLLHLALSL